MRKFLLFDFDGTIADTMPAIISIMQRVDKEFGYDLTEKEIIKLRGMSPVEIIRHFKFPPWKMPKLISRIREELAKEVKRIKIIPGMEKLLLDLKFKGYRMGILTSNVKETVDKFLLKHKLLIFDQIISEPGIFKKGRAFHKFLKDNDLDVNGVLYFGDEVRDIDFCRESGVKIVSVGWGFNNKEVLLKNKPDYFVEKPADLMKILLKV